MELYHSTRFPELQEIIRLRSLKIGDLEGYNELAALGIRGVWLTNASYGDSFFGPYQLCFDALDILSDRLFILERLERRTILLSSYSPMMPYFARVLKLDVLNAGDMVGPVRRENGNWSADNKIDVVCDFPIPMLKAKRIDVGMSTRGKKFSDPVEPQRGFGPSAQLLSLFLHSPKSDLDELVAESAQELANNLFRELHGRDVTFEKNVSTPKSPQLLAEMKGGDVVLSASKCLIEDDLKGGMFKASLAGSTEKLAENIAIAVNRRFDITSVNAAQILAY